MNIVRATTIGDVKSKLEAALTYLASLSSLPLELRGLEPLLPPAGTVPKVALCRMGTQREKIRTDAKSSNWNARTGKVVITFEPNEQHATSAQNSGSIDLDPEVELLNSLIKALDKAERDPRFREFVGLKSFRDQYLPALAESWTDDALRRREMLGSAIDQQLVKVCRVPNPKDPAFPTTAIRLNREHPDAIRVLKAAAAERSAFRPISIGGEQLSSTILAERR